MAKSQRWYWWSGAGALAGVGAALGGYAFLIEPHHPRFVQLELTLPRLDPAFDGYRVLHLSDLHLDNITLSREKLWQLAERVRPWNPDAVVVTGDMVTFLVRRYARQVAEGLAAFDTQDGIFAVFGNHDHWTDVPWIRAALVKEGIHVLQNTAHTLTRGTSKLHIAGVDDVYEKHDDIDAVLAALPEDGAAVLLAHEPDFADTSAATGRFDLQLSGHSHGGQIRLPWLGALWLPELGERYPMGLYNINGMIQYTSRGLGSLTPNIRFNCPPEVTLLTLRSGGVPVAGE